MNTQLQQFAAKLKAARTPADFFGDLAGSTAMQLAELALRVRKLLQTTHPDRNPAEQKLAGELFAKIQNLAEAADKQIRAGVYGKNVPLFSLTLRTGRYDIFEPLRTTDCFAVYRCIPAAPAPGGALRLKIVRDPQNNDLAIQEAWILRKIAANADPKGRRYFPKLVDSFRLPGADRPQQAHIIAVPAELKTLVEIRAAFPNGLDPRDAAWMFNRILEALYYTHNLGVVHGNITPDTLAVTIANHGLMLDEFPLAVKVGAPLVAIPPSFAAWFAGIETHCVTPALDIALAIRTLVYLLGGDPLTGELPRATPLQIQQFIHGSLHLPHYRRPNDAGALRREFDELLQKLYGPRTFRELIIPAA